jgi:hypothetical protein
MLEDFDTELEESRLRLSKDFAIKPATTSARRRDRRPNSTKRLPSCQTNDEYEARPRPGGFIWPLQSSPVDRRRNVRVLDLMAASRLKDSYTRNALTTDNAAGSCEWPASKIGEKAENYPTVCSATITPGSTSKASIRVDPRPCSRAMLYYELTEITSSPRLL